MKSLLQLDEGSVALNLSVASCDLDLDMLLDTEQFHASSISRRLSPC